MRSASNYDNADGRSSVELCTTGVSSITFKQAFQQQNEWCWAACISMVFEYYKHAVDQERIVKETWGTVANMPATPRHSSRPQQEMDGRRRTRLPVPGDVYSVNVNTAVED